MDDWFNSHKTIIYIDTEAQSEHFNWLASGWYFYDESGGIVGPYTTKYLATEERSKYFAKH
jgi:hypothetical protein